MDIIIAYDEVDLVKEQLQDVRKKEKEVFSELFKEMCSQHGEEMFSIPRRCGRQTHRANIPTSDPEAYWRITVFAPYLAHTPEDLADRFSEVSQKAVKGFGLLPSNCSKVDSSSLASNLFAPKT